MALDTTASPTILTGQRAVGGEPWVVTGTEADASTAVAFKTAPGAGKSLLIDYVLLTSDDADANPHIQDEDDTLLFGPFHTTVEGVVISKRFPNPIKVITNKALELKCAAAGHVSVYVEGRIQTDPA